MNVPIDPSGIFSVEDAAIYLGVCERRAREFCKEGRIGRRVGRRPYVITGHELIEFAKRERRPGKKATTPNLSSSQANR